MTEIETTEWIFDKDSVLILDKRRGEKPVTYPFEQMAVGTSFTAKRTLPTLKYAVRRYREAGNKEKHFAVRVLPEGGCRVWRVK